VIVSDGTGNFLPCVVAVSGAGRSRSTGHRLEPQGAVAAIGSSPHPIAVGLALHKGERPEWAVQKLTELGVDRILLLSSERTVVRPADGNRRRERLVKVARQAAAQSRRLRLPSVEGPFDFDEALAGAPVEVAVAEPGGPPVGASTATILVGPEGGWSGAELARAPALVGLADTVLRTETAAVAAGVLLSSLRSGRARAVTER
jgi:16S rRNA (uracil1498-N3)-methyltransferase